MAKIMTMKTTILLDEEVYERLVKISGKRNLSKTINEILKKELFKPKRSMYGADPWLNTEGLRNEDEPHGQ